MNLTRDILDQQVVDRAGQRLGKVDGVILELRDGEPPRVAAIEIGPVTLTRRIHPRLAEWLGGWLRRHEHGWRRGDGLWPAGEDHVACRVG